MHVIKSKNTDKIAENAVMLFRTNGYENVSVNDICRAADVSRSAFYTVFSSKKDVLEYVFEQPKNNSEDALKAIISAENDFERIWCLCERVMYNVIDFGPELSGSMLALQLQGSMGIIDAAHVMDDWIIKLVKNCQKSGIILSSEPAETLVPMATNIVYFAAYEWCSTGGAFSLRERARTYVEIIYNVAPKYRMPEDKKSKL